MATKMQRAVVRDFNRTKGRRRRFAEWTHRNPGKYGALGVASGALAYYGGGRLGARLGAGKKLSPEIRKLVHGKALRGAAIAAPISGAIWYGAARYMRNARRAVAKGKSRKR